MGSTGSPQRDILAPTQGYISLRKLRTVIAGPRFAVPHHSKSLPNPATLAVR
jgi:hypothetical protein